MFFPAKKHEKVSEWSVECKGGIEQKTSLNDAAF